MLLRAPQPLNAQAPILSHTLPSSNSTVAMLDEDMYVLNRKAGILVTSFPTVTFAPSVLCPRFENT